MCNRYIYIYIYKFTIYIFTLSNTTKSTTKSTEIIPLSGNTTKSTEKDLLETLILGIEDKRIWMEEKFWNELRDIFEDSEAAISLIGF